MLKYSTQQKLIYCPAPTRKPPYTSFSGEVFFFFFFFSPVLFELGNKGTDDLHSKREIGTLAKRFMYTQVPTPLWLTSFKRFFFWSRKENRTTIRILFFRGVFRARAGLKTFELLLFSSMGDRFGKKCSARWYILGRKATNQMARSHRRQAPLATGKPTRATMIELMI